MTTNPPSSYRIHTHAQGITRPLRWRGFDLHGLKAGDWFQGCEQCRVQVANTAAFDQCPICHRSLQTYTVTNEDLI